MVPIPPQIRWLEKSAEGRGWLEQLPARIDVCVRQWRLQLGKPYGQSCVSVVYPATMPDGSSAVLKMQFPHRESEHEAEALRRWNGQGAVQLIAHDPMNSALLLERCEPGSHLSTAGHEEALDVMMGLLPRLWVDAGPPFTTLSEEASLWTEQLPICWQASGRPFEIEMLDAAVEALDVLKASQGPQVLIHQDLHGDNVLRAIREPWLVIDPKPISGEREFGLSPIIRSYELGNARSCVIGRLDKLSGALGVDRERARLWAFGQTLAWAFEGNQALLPHIETARWLWSA